MSRAAEGPVQGRAGCIIAIAGQFAVKRRKRQAVQVVERCIKAHPGQSIGGELGTLVVTQIHQQPVGKDDVVSALGKVQLARISNLVAHILPAHVLPAQGMSLWDAAASAV